jgi:hypothetical protein
LCSICDTYQLSILPPPAGFGKQKKEQLLFLEEFWALFRQGLAAGNLLRAKITAVISVYSSCLMIIMD